MLTRKYILPLLALIGALLGLFTVFVTQKPLPIPPILFPPPSSPYTHAVAGAGIIEASSQNIVVASPFQEIVAKIFVVEGNHVSAGDPLFQLDLRNFDAQLKAASANLELAKIEFENNKKSFSFYERLSDPKAVSEQAYQQAYYALKSAEESVNVAEANARIAAINLERATIRAPIDGEILQLNIHVGEIAPIIPPISFQSTWLTASQGALLVMGSVNPLQVRIDIDEDDAWRFENGAKATAFVRGNSRINFPLTYLRTEPYMIPKSFFTGETAERVDTRVLQLLYTFDRDSLPNSNFPVYVGQVLDIYIETKSIEAFIGDEKNSTPL